MFINPITHRSNRRMRTKLLMLFFLAGPAKLPAQLFDELALSRFARPIGLGDAYTGIAEGLEALHYNTAGLAGLDQPAAIYANGVGEASVDGMTHATDAAVAIPLPSAFGVAGVSYSTSSTGTLWSSYVVSAHVARRIGSGFSAGMDLHYYDFRGELRDETLRYGRDASFSAHAFDISPSLMYTLDHPLLDRWSDRLCIGVLLRNAFSPRVAITGSALDPGTDCNTFQQLRCGASYRITPSLDFGGPYAPLQLVVAGDVVFFTNDNDGLTGANPYLFVRWRQNFGVELTFFELLQLRFGRENERSIKEVAGSSIFIPASHYGIGIILPATIMMEFGIPATVGFDFVVSDWDKIDEDSGGLHNSLSGFSFASPVQNSAFSVKATAHL